MPECHFWIRHSYRLHLLNVPTTFDEKLCGAVLTMMAPRSGYKRLGARFRQSSRLTSWKRISQTRHLLLKEKFSSSWKVDKYPLETLCRCLLRIMNALSAA